MPFNIQESVNATVAATDPNLPDRFATKERPAVGPLGDDPDRYTVYVPSEHTTLSLGQKYSKRDDPMRIQDVGITGRTDNHIHLHVQTNHKTLVSLGGSATSVDIEGHDKASVPQKSVGYAMVTDEDAWHDAAKQHYIVSRTADAVMRAAGEAGVATALVQSDKGVVTLAAGTTVSIGGQGAVRLLGHTGAPIETEPKYAVKVERKVTQDVDSKLGEQGKASTAHLKAVHEILKSAVKETKKQAEWAKGSWAEPTSAEVKDVLAKAEELYKALEGLLKPETKGAIDLIAEKQVSAHADHVALYGKSGASVTSEAMAEVSGDMALVAGKQFAAVWSGTHSSLKSGTNVSVEAEAGELTMQASKDVSIGSETKGVIVQGETDAQLNAKTGKAYVHGNTSAYVGAGGGAGYGSLASASKVQVGKLSSANDFSGPSPVADEGLAVEAAKLTATFKSSSVKLEASGATVAASKIDLEANGNVMVSGSKIMLG